MFITRLGYNTARRSTIPLARRIGTVSEVINKRAQEDIKDGEWIQDLLNKTEGGGYIVSNAGIFAMPVAWGDLDTFKHVNNVRYLKWFEEARVNMFNRFIEQKPGKGFETFMTAEEVGPIIRSVDLAWRYPISFPDKITVVHKLDPITESDRFILSGVIVSHNAKKVAARIKETIVTVDYPQGGKKAPIPNSIRNAFEERLKEQAEYK